LSGSKHTFQGHRAKDNLFGMEYLYSGVRKVYFPERYMKLPLSAYLFKD
jgi:hypothetical protein